MSETTAPVNTAAQTPPAGAPQAEAADQGWSLRDIIWSFCMVMIVNKMIGPMLQGDKSSSGQL